MRGWILVGIGALVLLSASKSKRRTKKRNPLSADEKARLTKWQYQQFKTADTERLQGDPLDSEFYRGRGVAAGKVLRGEYNPSDVKVRWHPQYRGTPTGGVITGYRVYAYIGHPLLGVVQGTETIVSTESEAKRTASEMRKSFKLKKNPIWASLGASIVTGLGTGLGWKAIEAGIDANKKREKKK